MLLFSTILSWPCRLVSHLLGKYKWLIFNPFVDMTGMNWQTAQSVQLSPSSSSTPDWLIFYQRWLLVILIILPQLVLWPCSLFYFMLKKISKLIDINTFSMGIQFMTSVLLFLFSILNYIVNLLCIWCSTLNQ